MKSELPQKYDPELFKVNLCIPPLGTHIVLAEPWSFDLFCESRNEKLIETLGLKTWVQEPNTTAKWMGSWKWNIQQPEYGKLIKKVTLHRGSKLSVRRIYIRNGVSEYNSVTFSLIKVRKKKGEPVNPHGRFWAKLYDVNQIVCYPVGDTPDVNATWTKPEANHLSAFKVFGSRIPHPLVGADECDLA